MGIRFYQAFTPGTRNRSVSDFSEITHSKPEKSHYIVQKGEIIVELLHVATKAEGINVYIVKLIFDVIKLEFQLKF